MSVTGNGAPPARSARVLRAALLMLAVLAGLWIIEGINAGTGDALDHYGIVPRTAHGLEGIAFAPFLHASFDHLAGNSLPLAILGFLVAVRGRFVITTLVIMLVSGLGVWLTAAPGSVTVGASGVILGYFGYLLARGVFDRSVASIAIAVLVPVIYGALIFAVLPGAPGVSWQAHLFGLIGGGLAAWVQRPARHPARANRYRVDG